jgi:hypothetical protein
MLPVWNLQNVVGHPGNVVTMENQKTLTLEFIGGSRSFRV